LYTPGVNSVLNITTGEGAQKNYTSKTGFGKLRKFTDGDDVPTVTRDRSYTTSVTYNNYGGSVEVTKNQIEDRDFAAELDEMKDLSRSANYSVDESAMQIFNGGFATTTTVNGWEMTWYGDAKPQYSTIHPTTTVGGSTQSNASSTGIKLGFDNFQTARLALELQKEDNGLALTMSGKNTLVVPLILEKTAMETINSPLVPENANNAINVYNGTTDIVTSKFLDSTNGGSNTAWFLINRAVHKMYYETRQEKRLESDINIKNKITTFTVDARWANYSRDWKGTWASKGDLAAYSS
jgi:phage major head subunit gpT-like protein